MYDFIFNNTTKVYFGSAQRKNLAAVVTGYGKRALLVYGGGSIKRNGLYDDILTGLHEAGIEVYEFGGISANPRHTKVNEGAELCREKEIDVILAVGGGSVIDSAKAISAACFYRGNCWDLVLRKAAIEKTLPVISVVTVAGTGSEMNCSCVISNAAENIKRGLSHELLQPKAAFLDPVLTYTVSAFQTACGSADILSHVLDTAYFLDGEKMEMLCMVMESVCKAVVRFAPVAIEHPDDYEARANLMWASSWGLNGFLKNGIRQLAVCHAIEHELSAYYDLNHGLGMAIVLPRWMWYVLDEKTAPIFARLGKSVFGICESSEMENARRTIRALEEFLYGELRLPSRLSEVGVDESMFHTMAEDVCWGSTLPGLKELTPNDVEQILELCR